MDAKEFLTLAKSLHGDDKNEVVYREVISLAYYGSYHSINPLAKHINLPTVKTKKPVGMHKMLCLQLQEYGEKNFDSLPKEIARKIYSLGLKLNQARGKRTDASYSLTDIVIKNDADLQLIETDKIMQLIHDIKLLLQRNNSFSEFFEQQAQSTKSE